MTSSNLPLVIGIDVGTSGVRSLAANGYGDVLAESHSALSDLPAAGSAHEQDPNEWWNAVCHTLKELGEKLGARKQWMGIAVTSTSGSLVLVDAQGKPVRAAMLYDDGRASAVASELNHRLPAGEPHINASFSLAKALWVRQEEPSTWKRASHIMHPADWLTAKLTGRLGVCDYSNALKLGYDQEQGRWSGAVVLADFPSTVLPAVVAPGHQVGTVSAAASNETGLIAGVPVLAGGTDGLASLIASGACEPGHANTTLGTTLVWKVLTRAVPRLGPGMYCHHLPNNLWAPGAASNTGPGSLHHNEPGASMAEMDRCAASHLPSPVQCYLLGERGERFPFLNPAARSFVDGTPQSPVEAYAAQLQSLACVERWGYERLESCGVTVGNKIFSAGSAAASPVLSQLRANILNRTIIRSANPTASFGAGILAAGTVLFGGDLTAAIRSMTRVEECHSPNAAAVDEFEKAYQDFRSACKNRGLE